jgi:RNA polymerase-binding transcription factor
VRGVWSVHVSVDLDRRRAELADLRVRLLGAAQDLAEGDIDDSELSTAGGDQHIADHAGDLLDREVDESLVENADEIVREIDQALGRIDEGTYGTCARCGREIPEERLEAVPYATLCVTCKHDEERG